MKPLITAIRTLTRIPVPGGDTARLADAMPFFPAVGLFIGLVSVAILHLFTRWNDWPLGAGIAAMIATVWLTRGLHVDGLADVSDALGGGRTRERRLAIMKDPHAGAFGVMAIACDLMLKAAALSRLAIFGHWGFVVVPFIASRTAQVLLATSLPYARAEGGKAGAFVDQARPLHFILAAIAALAFSGVIGGLTGIILLGQWDSRDGLFERAH